MPLSRLENFLKNAEGNILYVNPSDFDATDGYENQGNSLTRPFKTIQRALIEAARFSYQRGRNNDRIDRTTILVYPGTHYIDNRPGYSVENISNSAVYKTRTGVDTWTETILSEFGKNTNFDILDPSNDLHKFNSVHGGVILPRGTSIIGLDLRKTKIRPLYVPDPNDDTIESSSIFNVTGTCYFSTFTFFDADITREVYKDYTSNRYVPSFSHHKLVSFTYGDGVNKVALGTYQTDLTDLDMYYYKVAKAYGDVTGRGIINYPSNEDFEPSVDEYRIVGTLQANPLGISSITYGDGISDPSNLITVTTKNLKTGEEVPHGLFSDSPVYIDGVTKDPKAYNGSYIVKDVVGLTTFTYLADYSPTNILEYSDFTTATVLSESDTVSSASPYIFNCSIRSVYGMCGMWANGAKADGFKSMVVAQFTGVSLQKDDSSFMIYQNGNYEDDSSLSINSPERPLHSNGLAKYKPSFESYHIRVSDGGFVQCVSIFAIGYARHFLAESGGDMSITNSNSNFGSVSLESTGFRDESFDRDDVGYITHVIPPRELDREESDISWLSLDTSKIVSIGNTSRLYLFGYDDPDILPVNQVDGFRVGAKDDDNLYITLTEGTTQSIYSTPILMSVPSGTGVSGKKEYTVASNGLLNSIDTNGVITLTENHQLFTGEGIRIFSDDGIPPDNIECDVIYFAITSDQNPSLSDNQIQIAFTQNDASSGIKISGIGNNGGTLKVVSRVSDKLPGEFGHPVQYDSVNLNWYIVGAATSALNGVYKSIVDIGSSAIGEESPSTFISRKLDNRSIEDTIYKLRYVVPKEFVFARPPVPGFILQESKTVETSPISFNENESITEFTPPEYLRNEKIIIDVSAGAVFDGKQTVTVTTEKPHNFVVGDTVKIKKVKSTNNPTGLGITSTYNGSYKIASVNTGKEFTYEISGVKINPGTFTNKVNERDTNAEREDLPLVSRDEYKNTFYIYRVSTIRKHVPGLNGQDGVYHIIALSSNVSPSNLSNYNVSEKEFSQDVRNLYPQIDRDNIDYDPDESVSSSDLKTLGRVLTNDKRKSITKESLSHLLRNTRVGFGIVNLVASGVGNTTVTLYTDVEHGLNSIKDLNISIAGAGYGSTTVYTGTLVGGAGTHGTVRATLTAGSVTDVLITDSGSAYEQNDTLTVSPPPGITPSQNSVLTVTEINNNTNDGLQLSGFTEDEFNGVFRILGVPGPKSVEIYVPSVSSVPVIDTSNNRIPYGSLSAKGIEISSIIVDDPSSGIASVTTSSAHGLLIGNKFSIVGSGSTFNGTYTVDSIDINSPLTKFNFNVGVSTQAIPSASSGIILKNSFSSNASSLGQGEENLGSRCSYIYAGITTTTTANLTSTSTTISLSSFLGFSRGDYVLINDEIIRLSSSPIGSIFNVLRGQFGTYKTTSASGSQVKKIKVLPTELRRPSFMRASGHTFEYLGYGPGNYSTGMPQKQTTTLSEIEILTSQSRKQRGGVVVYSAMNDLGEFFSGNKKQSSTTGEEKVVDAPIISYTGDDAKKSQEGRLSGIFDDLLVRERLTVEGGENNNQTSQFYGPVNFTQKVTNTSESGINTKKIFVRGKLQQGKQITVGLGITSSSVFSDIISPKLGDIVLTNNPIPQKHIGFTYDGSDWQKYGLISQRPDVLDMRMDRLGIGDTTVFSPFGGVAGAELYVAGDAIFQNVYFTGNTIFDSQVVLNDVRFRDIDIRGTATFDLQPNPATGITSNYTQVHLDGASLLNDLYVAGISTFAKEINFNQNIIGIGATFGNIRIGYTSDNEIDTKAGSGNLTIDSDGGTVIVDDNLTITNGDFIVETGTSPTVSTKVVDSNKLQIGIGLTTNTSSVELYERDNLGLSISRNAIGLGNTESRITHYGLSDFIISSNDSGNLKLYTNNTERVRVGLSGTITTYQNNSGNALKGSHLKLNQAGSGDVALSWDITYNNSKIRWYAGIDANDSHSWKLAYPQQTVPVNSENFSTIDETKLKVSSDGSLNVFGDLNVDSTNGSSVATIATRKQNFNLIDDTALSVNFARKATNINVGSNSATSVVTFRSTKQSTTATNGGVVIDGGAGIAKNLYVGQLARVLSTTDSSSPSTGSLVVSGGVGVSKNLYVGGVVGFANTTDSYSSTTGSLVVSGGVGVAKSVYIGGTDNTVSAGSGALVVAGGVGVGANLYIGGTTESISKDTGALIVDGGVGIEKRLFVGSTQNATNKDSGSIITDGGVGVEKDVYIGGDATIDGGQITLSNTQTFIKLRDNVSNSLVFEEGTNDYLRFQTTNGSESIIISKLLSLTGNLNVDGTSQFDLAVNMGSTLTVAGLIDGNGGATIDSVRIGVANDNEIDTSGGNLILDSANGTVNITDNLDVDENLNVDGTSQFDLAVNMGSTLTVAGLIDGNGGAEIDNIRIGVANNNEIDTSSGNLTIDSAGGTTTIDDNLSVSGATTLNGNLIVNGSVNSTSYATGSAQINQLKLGIDGATEISTTSGNLVLDSSNGTVNITDNADVDGNLNVDGTLNVNSTSTLVGEVSVNTGIVPDSDEGAYLGTASLPFSQVYAGEIQIAPGTSDTTINTATGNLVLDSAGGTIDINDNVDISGNLLLTGDADIRGGDINLGNSATGTNIILKASNSDSLIFKTTSNYFELDTSASKIISHQSHEFNSTLKIFGATSGSTTIQSPATARTNTLTLPVAGSNITAYLARTSQSDGTITLGTDTNGNYLADITAGAGLTKTGSAGEGQSATLNIGAGTGIIVDADSIRLANSTSLSSNRVMKWSGTTLTNSSITDDGTTITLDGNVSIPNPHTLSFGSSARQMLNLYSTSYGLGVQSSTLYFRSGTRFSWFTGGTHSNTANNPGSGGTVRMTLNDSNLSVTGNVASGGTVSGNAGSFSGAVSATSFSGGGTIPIGGIIIWSGSYNNIPSGWRLCDGTGGTPDLRNRFVVCYGNSYPVGATGGSKDAVVVSHAHNVGTTGNTGGGGAHSHDITDPGHRHTYDKYKIQDRRGGGRTATADNATETPKTSFSTTGISIVGVDNHTHSVTVNASGQAGTDKNLPPYYSLCYIMRTS